MGKVSVAVGVTVYKNIDILVDFDEIISRINGQSKNYPDLSVYCLDDLADIVSDAVYDDVSDQINKLSTKSEEIEDANIDSNIEGQSTLITLKLSQSLSYSNKSDEDNEIFKDWVESCKSYIRSYKTSKDRYAREIMELLKERLDYFTSLYKKPKSVKVKVCSCCGRPY